MDDLRIHKVGVWRFDASSGELRQGSERRRLADRAARTLELLCRRRGQMVSHAEIVGEVWSGRALSPNSVAVVIADLRRELGDDARAPRFIETVAKRGYRLIAPAHDETDSSARVLNERTAVGLVAFALTGSVLAWATITAPTTAKPLVVVEDVENTTGDATEEPLARAIGELVVTDLRRAGANVARSDSLRDSEPPGSTRLKTRLILWTGRPAVALTVIDPRSGLVVWSAMMRGRAASFPVEVEAAMKSLTARLRSSRARRPKLGAVTD